MPKIFQRALDGIRRYVTQEDRSMSSDGRATEDRKETVSRPGGLDEPSTVPGGGRGGGEPHGGIVCRDTEDRNHRPNDPVIKSLLHRTNPLEGLVVRRPVSLSERTRRRFAREDTALEKIPQLVLRTGPAVELDVDERELRSLIGELVPADGASAEELRASMIRSLIARTNPSDELKGKEAPEGNVGGKKSGWRLFDRRDPSLALLPRLVTGGDRAERGPGTESGAGAEIVASYMVNPPYARVNITRDPDAGLRYCVVEPILEPREVVLLEEVYNYFRDVLLLDETTSQERRRIGMEELGEAVRMFDPSIKKTRLPVLHYYLSRNFYGYGRIDPLLCDPALEDISCNGPGIPVFVFHRQFGSIPTNIVFESEEMNRFVLRLAQKADKQISLSTPLVDAHLPDGSRVQLTFSDVVSTRGSSFTIRKFKKDPMTPVNLLQYGTFSAEMLAFVWYAIEHRSSAIIAGGTASGKTSTMNAISFFIPLNAKIVSLEDTREIQLPHQNWLPVQTRELSLANVKGEIDLFTLLKSSLRQRPEYIIVGEVRGSEAQTLFQAMNTGHTTLSTLHAGDIDEAINRLTNEPIAIPPVMFSALDLMIIQGIHHREGRIIRRCDSIHEIVVEKGGAITHRPLFVWDPRADGFRQMLGHSRVLSRIAHDYGIPEEKTLEEIGRRAAFLQRLLTDPPSNAGELLRRLYDLLASRECTVEEDMKTEER